MGLQLAAKVLWHLSKAWTTCFFFFQLWRFVKDEPLGVQGRNVSHFKGLIDSDWKSLSSRVVREYYYLPRLLEKGHFTPYTAKCPRTFAANCMSDLLNFELAGEQDLTNLDRFQVRVPPGWVVATCPHLIGPWVVQNSPLDPVSGWELTENGMKLVRFAQISTCQGTRFGLFGQVPGARCHLVGWWPPSHTWLDLGLWKIPPPDPFGAHCGVKIAPKLEGKNSQKCNSKFQDEFTWTQGGFLASNLMI